MSRKRQQTEIRAPCMSCSEANLLLLAVYLLCTCNNETEHNSQLILQLQLVIKLLL